MSTLIEQRIDIETSFIYNLWERHKSGEKHIKFLLTLYIREFELHPISQAHANRVISWIDNGE